MESQERSTIRDIASEWKTLSKPELAFLVVIAVVLITLGIVAPVGVEGALVLAALAGLLAGIVIALARRRAQR